LMLSCTLGISHHALSSLDRLSFTHCHY
jgi:hypothetical protein